MMTTLTFALYWQFLSLLINPLSIVKGMSWPTPYLNSHIFLHQTELFKMYKMNSKTKPLEFCVYISLQRTFLYYSKSQICTIHMTFMFVKPTRNIFSTYRDIKLLLLIFLASFLWLFYTYFLHCFLYIVITFSTTAIVTVVALIQEFRTIFLSTI